MALRQYIAPTAARLRRAAASPSGPSPGSAAAAGSAAGAAVLLLLLREGLVRCCHPRLNHVLEWNRNRKNFVMVNVNTDDECEMNSVFS